LIRTCGGKLAEVPNLFHGGLTYPKFAESTELEKTRNWLVIPAGSKIARTPASSAGGPPPGPPPGKKKPGPARDRRIACCTAR